jgi:hypothetical protein
MKPLCEIIEDLLSSKDDLENRLNEPVPQNIDRNELLGFFSRLDDVFIIHQDMLDEILDGEGGF